MKHKRLTFFALIVSVFLLACAGQSRAMPMQQRDHLTEQEADLVRDAQAIDKRMEVFIRAVERRLLVLTDPQAADSKQVQKEMERWGPLPKGSRFELFSDIGKILDEAITNIDDASTRSPNNELLNKGLRKLSEATTHFIPQLETLRANSRGPELEALARINEYADSIIDAAKKLPPPPTKNSAQKH